MTYNNNISTKRGHLCSYCKPGVTHIIDPSLYPNDVIAKEVEKGKWKCGNCQETEAADLILKTTPNSDRAKEIRAERKKKKNHEMFLQEFQKRAMGVRVTGGKD